MNCPYNFFLLNLMGRTFNFLWLRKGIHEADIRSFEHFNCVAVGIL